LRPTDLNYIFHDMLSEMTVGLRGGGGQDLHLAQPFREACWAADFELGRRPLYASAGSTPGESWNRMQRSAGRGRAAERRFGATMSFPSAGQDLHRKLEDDFSEHLTTPGKSVYPAAIAL